MTSEANIYTPLSPQQALSTPGLDRSGEAAWISRFATQAVSHMAMTGVMSLKQSLAYLLEQDSNHPERDSRG